MTIKDKENARRRLPRKERERLIVEEAARFFAEVGFEGQTRSLAQRLGVTQPLLYRYFPDKEALIERVYHEVFVGGWDPSWTANLGDRSRPLHDRVMELYRNYSHANFSYERVRLFLFAGLKDQAIANRYLGFVHDNLFIPLCREVRAEAGLDPEGVIGPAEIECVAGLHGAIGYVGLRRWVYQSPVVDEIEVVLGALVNTFLLGAKQAFKVLSPA